MTEPEHKPSVEAALDLLVYAPLGLALEARTLLPSLAERGRNQVTMARMVGRFAVQQGQVEASKRLGPVQEQVEAVLVDLGLVPRPPGPSTPPSGTSTPSSASSPDDPAGAADAPGAEPALEVVPDPEPAPDAPAAEDLAVTDYDSLAASQVVPRLRGLSPEELEDVRRYEAAGRGRKTILNRIAQLQAR